MLIHAPTWVIMARASPPSFSQKATTMSVQTLKKWGNSPAVRIPAALMEVAHLALNQQVEVWAENGRVIIEPLPPPCSLGQLLAAITPENCHAEVDFGTAQGSEAF